MELRAHSLLAGLSNSEYKVLFTFKQEPVKHVCEVAYVDKRLDPITWKMHYHFYPFTRFDDDIVQ